MNRRSIADTVTDLFAIVALVVVVLAIVYIPMAGVVPTVRRLLDGDLVDPCLAVLIAVLYLAGYTAGELQ